MSYKCQNVMVLKEISSYNAIKEVYKHKRAWEFLHSFIESSEEVEEDEDGNILFVYWDGKTLDKNYYTNDNKYFWIAGYENNRIVFLQLVGKISSRHIELVVAQKRYSSKAKNCFGEVVEFIKQKYDKTKYLTTFPMNDVLKEYYKSKGFFDYKNELKMNLK